jgi:uncharacterized protein with PQ loop repeat
MSFSPAEIVGYIASLFVLVSFLMKDIKKLRLINSVGCMLFVIYGVLLNFSIPIILTNTAILIINTIALLKKPS